MTAAELQIEPLTGLDPVRDEWSELARRQGNLFATPEWGEAWLAHIGDQLRLEPRLYAARRPDGSLAVILPLVVVGGRYVRKLRLLGFGPANELGPIAAPDDRQAAAQALGRALAATRREWDLFLGDNLPGTGWRERIGGAIVRREGSPVVAGAWPSWDDYLATRTPDFRQELRRKERRLAEQGLEYRLVTREEELGRALDLLFGLHRARWGEEASFWFAGQEPFHRAFARVALANGWLRLRLLELDGEPVAAYQGFRFEGAEWSYQYGRAPSARRGSVGLILIAHAVREALAQGVRDFRFGPGAQEYKVRFSTSDPGLETVGVARGVRGRMALWAARRRG
jgi:CelD/BcsL family acetyltransferase involved in cellulose biosynthesis